MTALPVSAFVITTGNTSARWELLVSVVVQESFSLIVQSQNLT